MNRTPSKLIFLATLSILLIGCGRVSSGGKDVAASFVGGSITVGQLKEYAANFIPQCHQSILACGTLRQLSGCKGDELCGQHKAEGEMSCCQGNHGGEHAGCCGGSQKNLKEEACLEHKQCCLQHANLTVENYKDVLKAMALEYMIKERIKEEDIAQDRDIQGLLKYVSENVYLTATHQKMEEEIRILEEEIREYYNQRKEVYGSISFEQARKRIEDTLKRKMHEEQMPIYIEELKKGALITKNLRLLEMDEPTERELRGYYALNPQRYGQEDFSRAKNKIKEDFLREREQVFFREHANDTLFMVNGQIYTLADFQKIRDGIPPELQEEYEGSEGQARLMDRMIEYELLAQDAMYKVTSPRVIQATEEIKGSLLERAFYQKEIIEKVTVSDITDAEAKEYYRKNKKRFRQPTRAKISYIRVSDKARAGELFKRIRKGEDFAALAREYSEDDQTASQGGRLDAWIYEGMELHPYHGPVAHLEEEMFHPFHERVFRLKLGQVSKPFEFRGSYYIVKLRERVPGTELDFEEVKDFIKEILVTEKREQRLEELKEELLAESGLKIHSPSLKAMLRQERKSAASHM